MGFLSLGMLTIPVLCLIKTESIGLNQLYMINGVGLLTWKHFFIARNLSKFYFHGKALTGYLLLFEGVILLLRLPVKGGSTVTRCQGKQWVLSNTWHLILLQSMWMWYGETQNFYRILILIYVLKSRCMFTVFNVCNLRILRCNKFSSPSPEIGYICWYKRSQQPQND